MLLQWMLRPCERARPRPSACVHKEKLNVSVLLSHSPVCAQVRHLTTTRTPVATLFGCVSLQLLTFRPLYNSTALLQLLGSATKNRMSAPHDASATRSPACITVSAAEHVAVRRPNPGTDIALQSAHATQDRRRGSSLERSRHEREGRMQRGKGRGDESGKRLRDEGCGVAQSQDARRSAHRVCIRGYQAYFCLGEEETSNRVYTLKIYAQLRLMEVKVHAVAVWTNEESTPASPSNIHCLSEAQ